MQCSVDCVVGIMNSRNVMNYQHHHRRGHSFNSFANINVLSNSNSSHGKLSFESGKLATTGIDDLLSSSEGGKHDYDWLLTPPGTPTLPSSRGESQPTSGPQKSSLGRPMSNNNGSRLSVSQSENNNHSHSRPSRSTSVTRNPNRSSSTSIHNTSPASVSSHTRPSSPITRSPSAARPSTPTSRSTTVSTPPRLVLPRSLPNPTNSSSTDTNKTRTPQILRPSTPSSSSRPPSSSIPTNLHTPRSLSRSSTPTRRHSLPSPSPPATRVGRNSTPRPQPIVPPDFPLETPPNLRTTLPADRPVSAGRSRPLKPNSETVTISRRQSSPIVNRGRLSEYTAKGRGHANAADASDAVSRKSVKSSTIVSENNGLGRTISKKSLDMAIRHMDVRNSSGNLRSLSSATLYPQSIRTSTPKTQQHTRGLSVPASMNINGSLKSRNNGIRERDDRQKQYFAKLNEVDVYESYRYDSLLLKEDLNNTNWLHSVDEECDQGPIFDNGFESLPEPFGLL